MRTEVFVSFLCSLPLALAGCDKLKGPESVTGADQESNQPRTEVCGLLTKEEIEAIQGSPIKETKSSTPSDGAFRVSQCFYTATEFSKSVSLAVMQGDPGRPTTTGPRDFWKKRFGRYTADGKERGKDKDESEHKEEESVPPKKIDGIGEEAFWASNRFGGMLYVLKDDAFIFISLGGPDDEETKLKKSKALAEKALQRL